MLRKTLAILLSLLFVTAMIPAGAEDALVFSYWGGGYEKEIVEDALRRFTEQTGIPVEGMHIPEDYNTKLTAMAAANTLPDLGYMSESLVVEWGMNDMFVDMTDMYSQPDFAKKLEQNTFKTPDGKILGTSLGNEVALMFYNKAIFDAAGVPYPPSKAEDAWTWEEFVEVAKKLTKDSSGKTPNDEGFNPDDIVTYGCRLPKWGMMYYPFLYSNGGGFYSEDYKELLLNKPESVEVFQKMADLIYVDHVHPTPDQNSTVPGMDAAFLSNCLAMQVDGQWSLQALAEAHKEDDIQFGIGVLPKFKEPATSNVGCPVVVFKSSKQQENALKLARFLQDPGSVLPLIQSGLWQANEQDWYTDEEKIAQWITEGVHPEEYRTAVIDYCKDYLRENPFFKLAGTNKIDDLIGPALDQVWSGKMTAQEAIDGAMPEIQKVWDTIKH